MTRNLVLILGERVFVGQNSDCERKFGSDFFDRGDIEKFPDQAHLLD